MKFRVFDVEANEYSNEEFYMTKNGRLWRINPAEQRVKNCIVEYSSGIVDRKGAEIFAGDAYEKGGEKYYVIYEDGGFVIRNFKTGRCYDVLSRETVQYREITITGNIHEVNK